MTRPLIASLGAALLLGFSMSAHSSLIRFYTTLSGDAEDPPVTTPATGKAWVIYDDVNLILSVQLEFEGLIGQTTVAHIHAPTALPGSGNAGVATYPGTFPGFPSGVHFGAYYDFWSLNDLSSFTPGFLAAHGGTAEGAAAGLLQALQEGRAYVNIHTSEHSAGEIRGFLRQVPDGGATAWMLTPLALGILLAHRQVRRG